jgi:hypothetical protein
VPRALQGADRGGYRRINIGASGGQDPARKGGIIAAAVLGVKHKTEIEKLRFVSGKRMVTADRI